MVLLAQTAQHRPTRVLFFCPTLGDGGADRVVLTLLQRLDRARIAPALAVIRRAGALIDDVPADVPTFELGSRRLLVAAPDLARLVRRERPDVVFSTHGGSNVIAALAHALARSPARLVLSERSALVREDRGRIRRALELPAKRVTYRRADLVTAVSAGVARELAARLGLPAAKIRVVYNPAVDDDLAARAAEPVAHPWFAPGAAVPVIAAVGRLVAIKDYPTLLAAFARIRAARPARLFVLGDGPLRAALEARVRAAGLAGDVELFGFDKNPLKYVARARLLLHASRAEGLPGALIQAMACGTPVVATDCDHGPREVIARPGHDGFLVPVGDAAALAERALALLADEPLAARVGAAARQSAQRFGAAAALAAYEAAITGAAAPGASADPGGGAARAEAGRAW
ncbi:MAG TPA: glycosyltransferase [Kofleriaceae bacterium]|nr:glycosyltransferase [Kofleriaceae bacterium]